MRVVKGNHGRARWRSPVVVGALRRPCPRCPAGPYAKCQRWIGENYTVAREVFRGEGRWSPTQSPHARRVSPNTAETTDLVKATSPCADTGKHGYHWHGGDSSRYCRGVIG